MFRIEEWWNRKWTGAIVVPAILVALCIFIYALTHQKLDVGYNKGYQPDQPIPFSHQLHAGQYKMDCRYCHTSVEESRHASAPSLNICMNCHINIKVDSPWIQKLRRAFDEDKPIQWQKVHLLADFVKFNHAPHIKALIAGQDLPDSSVHRQSCQTCHGKVEEMPIVFQKESLSMGWCIDCHRKEENKPWLLQCSTCHY